MHKLLTIFAVSGIIATTTGCESASTSSSPSPTPIAPTQAVAAVPPAPPVPPPPPQPCLIKGNTNFNTGERIYHVPGDPYYDATVIEPANGERMFCSEAEAVAAGWRKQQAQPDYEEYSEPDYEPPDEEPPDYDIY